MHPLGKLIAERMDHPDHRWSLDDVVTRARLAGEKLGRSNLSNLRNKMTPQLSRATIYGLAAGLGVTPSTVANAALQSWGIELRTIETTDAVETIRIDPTLGESQRRQLVALVAEMRGGSPRDVVVGPDDVKQLPRGGRIIRQSAPRKHAAVRADEKSLERHQLGGG